VISDPSLKEAKILAVDDELLIVLDIEMSLREAGAETVWACTTVAEAAAVAADEDVTVAILDVRVGQTTSEVVAEKLRERGIPFLFYSGQDLSPKMVAQFPDVGILKKPLRIAGLIEAVAALLPSH
jgi:DNA-binding response OmpR family regulator